MINFLSTLIVHAPTMRFRSSLTLTSLLEEPSTSVLPFPIVVLLLHRPRRRRQASLSVCSQAAHTPPDAYTMLPPFADLAGEALDIEPGGRTLRAGTEAADAALNAV